MTARGRPTKSADQLPPIGAAIRRRRLATGKTIRQIAAEADVPERTWANWEHGDLETAARLKLVAAALCCDLAELLGDPK